MRIVGGKHRSRKLETPKNDAVRPTSDKVRLAVFNMLHSRGVLQDAVVIDAFCGTGALGLEALSQGAKFCTFFDKSKDSVALCKSNVMALKEEESTQVIFQDVTKIKDRPDNIEAATLVFLDPPYNKNIIPPSIHALHESGWLARDCFFVMETDKAESIDCPLITITDEKIYGDTKITLGVLKA